MLRDVKILNSADSYKLNLEILKLVNDFGYKLLGPVSVAVTLGNDIRYVATLVKEGE